MTLEEEISLLEQVEAKLDEVSAMINPVSGYNDAIGEATTKSLWDLARAIQAKLDERYARRVRLERGR